MSMRDSAVYPTAQGTITHAQAEQQEFWAARYTVHPVSKPDQLRISIVDLGGGRG